jgi:hypothetical protein
MWMRRAAQWLLPNGILHTLEAFRFAWDGEVVWQSRRTRLPMPPRWNC